MNNNNNIFLEMLEQIENFDEEELDKIYKDYISFVESLKVNESLANEVKQKMKIEGATASDVISVKETFINTLDNILKTQDLSEKKKRILGKIREGTLIIYDKVAEDFDFITLNIPVELCHPNAKLPTYAHDGDAGFDIYLPENFTIKAGEHGKIAKIGLKMAIPKGYELQIRPRSGNSVKTNLRISNAPGTIDCGYRDEIGVICDNIGNTDLEFKAGDRIAQGVLSQIPKGKFQQIEDITKIAGNRNGGFGSTGK